MENDRGVRVVAGILHAQRREDVVPNKGLVRASGDLFDQVGQQHIARIAVAPFLARCEVERFVPEPRHQLLGRGGKRFELRVIRKARKVRNA